MRPDDETVLTMVENTMDALDEVLRRYLREHSDVQSGWVAGLHDRVTGRVLGEIHRILEKGGRVRIVVPDAEKLINAYIRGDREAWADFGFEKLPATFLAIHVATFRELGGCRSRPIFAYG